MEALSKSPAADQSKQGPTDKTNAANNNDSIPTIKGPRDRRFIAALVAGETSTFDLLHVVGAMNIWDLCARLKGQGWLINTDRKSYIDRDGKRTKAGFYSIDPSQIPVAISALYPKQEAC